jgi:hypothetical protein
VRAEWYDEDTSATCLSPCHGNDVISTQHSPGHAINATAYQFGEHGEREVAQRAPLHVLCAVCVRLVRARRLRLGVACGDCSQQVVLEGGREGAHHRLAGAPHGERVARRGGLDQLADCGQRERFGREDAVESA